MDPSDLIYLLVLLPPLLGYRLGKHVLAAQERGLHHGQRRLRQSFLPHLLGMGIVFSLLWFAAIAIWAASISSADPYLLMVYLPCAFGLGEFAGTGSFLLYARAFHGKRHPAPGGVSIDPATSDGPHSSRH